jgi:serine/threonine-protein phosphatase 2A regulatory subunit B
VDARMSVFLQGLTLSFAAEAISAVAFSDCGEYIATGDKGGTSVALGRVWFFGFVTCFLAGMVVVFHKAANGDYERQGAFRSHEPEFDYLKSLEIEEKINKIRWLKTRTKDSYMLTTNDKTIKLWRCGEKSEKTTEYISNGQLAVPRLRSGGKSFFAKPRRLFANAHAYHINSISVNSDQETYISSDDLRINLWNIGINDQAFNVVDIKPENMEELTEVITSAEFHPNQCSLMMYSSSKGTIKLCDLRDAALCDVQAKTFEEEEDPATKSFFSEIISSISDIKFSADGRYIVSRDYMNIKLWDMNKEDRPVKSIPVHDYLKTKLCDLYENDCIFDKFECTVSHNANYLLTGSYGNYFFTYDVLTDKKERVEIRKKGAKVIVSGFCDCLCLFVLAALFLLVSLVFFLLRFNFLIC